MKITNKDEFDKVNKFGTGESNDAFAEYFVGKSFLQPITQLDEANLGIANVTFELDAGITGIFTTPGAGVARS